MSMRPIDKLLSVRNNRAAHGGRLSVTAGGAGDNTATTLVYIDRLPANAGMFETAKLVIMTRAVLAQAATATLTVQLLDATSVGGAGAANFGSATPAAVIATGGTGGSTELVATEIDVDLSGAREFVAARVTLDMSASGTDTATVDAVWVLGGSDRGPVTQAVATVRAA
jgi:hypothetical protein